MPPQPQAVPVALPALLVVGVAENIDGFLPSLRQQFSVGVAASVGEAVAAIERERPAFIVTDIELRDGPATAICVAAKRFTPPATVLVTAADPAAVPDALAAGCDGVLLKPFAPNLLYARIGRLMRERARDARMRTALRRPDGTERQSGTNRYWPDERCPHCHAAGVTSFEFHSHRRAWFACTDCRKVWIGARLEEF